MLNQTLPYDQGFSYHGKNKKDSLIKDITILKMLYCAFCCQNCVIRDFSEYRLKVFLLKSNKCQVCFKASKLKILISYYAFNIIRVVDMLKKRARKMSFEYA